MCWRHLPTVWLYSDDVLLRFACGAVEVEDLLASVREVFTEFGKVLTLRLNLSNTKVLMQGMGPWPPRLEGMSVAPDMGYLGALFGDVSAQEAYDKGVSIFEYRSTLISRMPLSIHEKVQLIHAWCYPLLQITGVAYSPPPPLVWSFGCVPPCA